MMRALTVGANSPAAAVGRGSLVPRVGVPLLGFCLLSALLISRWPLQLSVATVFLFSGPHNWMEFRYFLARMPARWGPLRGFFLLGIGGALALTVGFAA